jgi:hypothetical protein
VKKTPRKKWGTNVAQAKPFSIFPGAGGKVGVRIGTSKPFFSADEVIVSAAPVRITCTGFGLHVTGEGVVRRHKSTIAVTS